MKHKTPGRDSSSPGCFRFVSNAKLGSLAGLAQGSLTTGADVEANTNTVDDDALLVHVRAEIPIGAALGETHIISERLGLATDITLPSHGQLPSNQISYRYDSGDP